MLPRHLREVDDLPLGHLLLVIKQCILRGYSRERVDGHPGGDEVFAGEVVGPQIRERNLRRRHVDPDGDILVLLDVAAHVGAHALDLVLAVFRDPPGRLVVVGRWVAVA